MVVVVGVVNGLKRGCKDSRINDHKYKLIIHTDIRYPLGHQRSPRSKGVLGFMRVKRIDRALDATSPPARNWSFLTGRNMKHRVEARNRAIGGVTRTREDSDAAPKLEEAGGEE